MMNKTQKLVNILMLVIILVFIPLILIISDIKLKDIPLWAIIGIPTLVLVTPFTFFLAQRSTQRTLKDASLQKKRKRLLTVFIVLIIFSAAMLTVMLCYAHNHVSVWIVLFQCITFLLVFFFLNFRILFPKKKEFTEEDNQI